MASLLELAVTQFCDQTRVVLLFTKCRDWLHGCVLHESRTFIHLIDLKEILDSYVYI